MHGSNLQIQARDGIQVGAIGNHRDDVERVFPNVFMFCCSIENGEIPHSGRLKHFKASDYWLLNSPESFAASVGKYLAANGQTSDGSSLKDFECRMSCGSVSHVDRSPARVDERISDIDLLVFQKERCCAMGAHRCPYHRAIANFLA